MMLKSPTQMMVKSVEQANSMKTLQNTDKPISKHRHSKKLSMAQIYNPHENPAKKKVIRRKFKKTYAMVTYQDREEPQIS